jgi:hypothetical protein
VIVDVAIDQGGCTETSRPTTHSSRPTSSTRWSITASPTCRARWRAPRPSRSTTSPCPSCWPGRRRLPAGDGRDPHLRNGLNVHEGKVTHKAVAEALGHEFVKPEAALRLALFMLSMTPATDRTQAGVPHGAPPQDFAGVCPSAAPVFQHGSQMKSPIPRSRRSRQRPNGVAGLPSSRREGQREPTRHEALSAIMSLAYQGNTMSQFLSMIPHKRMNHLFNRRALLLGAGASVLAGCSAHTSTDVPVTSYAPEPPRHDPYYVNMYRAMPDEEFPVPAIDLSQIGLNSSAGRSTTSPLSVPERSSSTPTHASSISSRRTGWRCVTASA